MSKYTTKKAIEYAFKELLIEKPFNKITVNDIAEKCSINRQTFYYHFLDIRDLVEWICIEDSEKVLKENKTYTTWQEGFLDIFNLMLKDKVFVINIYNNVHREALEQYLFKITYNLLLNVVNEVSSNYLVREEDKKFIAEFYKYSYVGIVLDWIKNDMKEDPKIIINKLSLMIKGSFELALSNLDTRKK